MKIKKLVFNEEKITLPKEIEIEYEKESIPTQVMWKTIKALVKEYRKEHKVLNIIKKKKIQIGMFIRIHNDEQAIESAKIYQGNYFLYLYNSMYGYMYGELTQEEYDLLKEELL